jgi:hypothetical protein
VKQVLCIVTANYERRARHLAEGLGAHVTYIFVDRSESRLKSIRATWQALRSKPWDMVYLEGTGISGGVPCIAAALFNKQKFVVSSGDPIGGFFHTTHSYLMGTVFGAYERLLYMACAGFVGWTPYLTGLSLLLGAKRAATVIGTADPIVNHPYSEAERSRVRAQFGISDDELVCGVMGNIQWVDRQRYCYGLELVEMLKRVKRTDLKILIAGDGTGRRALEDRIPQELKSRAIFTGNLAQEELIDAINAMDIGFVTQTLNILGNFRLTTKLPEYLYCGVPVAMSPTPGYFDFVMDSGWALPSRHPSSGEFHQECADWLDRLDISEVRLKGSTARKTAEQLFNYDRAQQEFATFVHSLM